MAHITKHQLNQFLQKYGKTDVTFNKNIIHITKLIPSEVYIKLGKKNYPCILNSSSMAGARVILQAEGAFFEELNNHNKKTSLRYAFMREDNSFPLTFFIKSVVESFNPLKGGKPNLYFLNLEYTQNPPSDLIEILGTILDTSSKTQKRKDERITINPVTIKALNLKSASTLFAVDKSKKSCIIRDLSFYGAKIITAGTREMYLDKEIRVVIQFSGEPGNCLLLGKVVRCDTIKANDAFVLLAVHFEEKKVSLDYINVLNAYFEKNKK